MTREHQLGSPAIASTARSTVSSHGGLKEKCGHWMRGSDNVISASDFAVG